MQTVFKTYYWRIRYCARTKLFKFFPCIIFRIYHVRVNKDDYFPISTKFGTACRRADLIMHDNFLAIGLRVLILWGVEFCHFPI